MVRAFEREELAAYIHHESGTTWEKYAGVFEHLTDADGNPRAAFSWFWMGFFGGPIFLIVRKSYISGFGLLACSFGLAFIHPGLMWIPWPLVAPIAGPILLHRFLAKVRESRALATEAERKDFLRKEGGFSIILDIMSFFG